jgi:phosphopantothenoylcysteine decarboxylase/phosphopantothenate--cysteine ligase
MLKDKKILLGVTGGIAVYKAVELASRLTKLGAVVKTVMTDNAREFVTPLTFKSITHQSVSYRTFNEDAPIEHISLADWADFIVIAPATANIIGKLANGIADDLLSTVLMAAKAKKLIVPAMNVNMYENAIVQENIEKLKEHDFIIMEADSGRLACGYDGKGRFPDPVEIVDFIKVLANYNQDLKGKRILVSGGASREKIDPMRFISNNSTGKMGLALAKSAFIRGAEVKFVHGFIEEHLPYYLNSEKCLPAQSMYESITSDADNYDIIIMCAAVADYTIKDPAEQKIKKNENMSLDLSRTKDILLELGSNKKAGQVLLGFAAESENIIENAKDKLKRKNLDYIAANSLYTTGSQDTEITLISKTEEKKLSGSKFECANQILKEIVK